MAYQSLSVALVVALFAGCTGDSGNVSPKLEVNIEIDSGIRLCQKVVGKTYQWQNLQLNNTGKGDLIVSNIEVRGDANCAFQVYREVAFGEDPAGVYLCPQEHEKKAPFEMIVPAGASRLVRIEYTPSAANVLDQAALVITSNATNIAPEEEQWKPLILPMCGRGIAEETDGRVTQNGDLDGGVDSGFDSGTDAGGDADSDTDTDSDTDVDTDTDADTEENDLECPSCDENLAEGAPWCSGGY